MNTSYNASVIANVTVTTVSLTDGELWFQLIFSYGIVGVLSAILHLLIAVVVVTVERLQSRFFVFIFFMSIARVLYGISHIIISTFRILRTLGIVDKLIPSLTCHVIEMFTFGAATLDLELLLIVVIDRVISFLKPLTYRNFTRNQAIRICVIAYLACFFFRFLPSYAGLSTAKMVSCISSAFVVTPAYATYSKYLDFALSFAILLAYIVLFWAIRRCFGKNKSGSNMQDAAIKKSMKIMPFLRLQLIMHCSLNITSRLFQLIADQIGSGTAAGQRFQAYYGQLCSIDVLTNAIIFYWRHPALWTASVKLICGARVGRWFESKKGSQAVSEMTKSNVDKAPSSQVGRGVSAGQIVPIQ